MNKVNVVNVGERYKNITFITYQADTKGLVNVVNVAQKSFACRARELPNAFKAPLASFETGNAKLETASGISRSDHTQGCGDLIGQVPLF